MNRTEAENIVDSIRTTYNNVASQFIASRTRDWNEFEILLSLIQTTDIILDAGCAHGRLVPALLSHGIKKENYTGIDISEELIKNARETFPEMCFDIGDVCKLPYTNETFDTVISSAVLHHIPSKKLQIQMLQELVRVTKPGGKILLLVWNAFFFKHLWKPILLSYLRSIFSFGKHTAGDMYLPFFGDKNQRFVHAFTEQSLRQLVHEITCKKVILQNTGKNFFIVLEK